MKTRIAVGLLAVACMTMGWSGAAEAQVAAKRAAKLKKVTITGCPKILPIFCTGISAPSGQTYIVSGAVPPVPVGTVVIRLTGTVSSDVGICSGTVLKDIKWRPTKKECPKT